MIVIACLKYNLINGNSNNNCIFILPYKILQYSNENHCLGKTCLIIMKMSQCKINNGPKNRLNFVYEKNLKRFYKYFYFGGSNVTWTCFCENRYFMLCHSLYGESLDISHHLVVLLLFRSANFFFSLYNEVGVLDTVVGEMISSKAS